MANEQNLKPWKPGQSGNPAGKPKGTKHLSTWIQELMSDEEFETYLQDAKDGWKSYKGAPVKAIVKVAMIKALGGDKSWADWLANNGWKQQIDVTSNGEKIATQDVDPALAQEWTEFLKSRTKDAR